MQTNSRVAIGEVNHQSRLYTFSEFIELDFALLLTHADESSRIWHERFEHLNFRYMQHLSKQGMVDGLSDIHFSKGICEGCVLGKHPQEKFDKGKTQKASSPLDMIHSDLMGPFPHLSINKARYMLIFVDEFSTVPYISQQNGVAERKNRSLKEMASCMLPAKSLSQRLWVEALNCATYIQNKSPHKSVKDKTPYGATSNRK
jgi:hypothetical protein